MGSIASSNVSVEACRWYLLLLLVAVEVRLPIRALSGIRGMSIIHFGSHRDRSSIGEERLDRSDLV